MALLFFASVLIAALLAAIVALWRDPMRLVRGEFARQRRAAGLSRGMVEAAGHRWVYAHRAAADPAAPVVVMVHGFTGSKENWYPLARALGGRYRLLIPDLPGWGESERRPGAAYGFVEQAANVAAFIDALSPERPVVLLGHSMGGGIAALVAARWPERIAKVGLFNAAGVRFDDNQFGLDVLAGKNPFAVEDAATLRRFVDTVFFDDAAKPWIPWPASAALIAKRRADAAFEQTVLDRIGRGDESLLPGEEASRIRQPALLLWGRQDAVIDPSALALYAARIPQARQVLLDGCGHMSIAERPREVAEALVRFLQ
ncbi:alpha/beta hydrolase [Thermomonas brevis]|uniref:Alpha/beta hydrolase n=1 Tax=Thermomonas brevis TaxID=215691 RepID=A0A7G9QQ03_9GAMM|nr:alpha/beta hydrolase [Thermomonas brevis]QNN45428.1 alpha/beta hydrolase [Thermomonas brevis]